MRLDMPEPTALAPAMLYGLMIARLAERRRAVVAVLLALIYAGSSMLAGPIALKTSLDETVVCALVSTILLALAKLGRDEVARILDRATEVQTEQGAQDEHGFGQPGRWQTASMLWPSGSST